MYGEIEFDCNHYAVFENAIDMVCAARAALCCAAGLCQGGCNAVLCCAVLACPAVLSTAARLHSRSSPSSHTPNQTLLPFAIVYP